MTYSTGIVYRFTQLTCCSGHVVTLTFDFQGQISKWLYHRNGVSDWQETKVIWIETMLDLLYDLDLWPVYDLDLGFSRSNFPIVMPPPLGAGGIMFSGCPSSVRSLKYPLLTCTWVRWSTQPTVTILRHVRPSVRPSREVSGHLPENAWREWPEILHADVSWPFSELISLWPWFVDFSNFGTILT